MNMFITAVCVIFLIKLRRPKTKSLYQVSLPYIFWARQYFVLFTRKYANQIGSFEI